jgi:hypothetical protein
MTKSDKTSEFNEPTKLRKRTLTCEQDTADEQEPKQNKLKQNEDLNIDAASTLLEFAKQIREERQVTHNQKIWTSKYPFFGCLSREDLAKHLKRINELRITMHKLQSKHNLPLLGHFSDAM